MSGVVVGLRPNFQRMRRNFACSEFSAWRRLNFAAQGGRIIFCRKTFSEFSWHGGQCSSRRAALERFWDKMSPAPPLSSSARTGEPY